MMYETGESGQAHGRIIVEGATDSHDSNTSRPMENFVMDGTD